ncbi:hypothetical protein G5C51_03445 [Streptomyces sp. A7024]|uniref:Uncharacterized protein n=1 Tax=Streptomyces coryli TaxID=1128680 RepID=A0A6G4TV22_9ACTN|nr:hypothetical protein [Streptomyces coryli]NGN62958.1 hypothetical protein [Streptomyces coryli]
MYLVSFAPGRLPRPWIAVPDKLPKGCRSYAAWGTYVAMGRWEDVYGMPRRDRRLRGYRRIFAETARRIGALKKNYPASAGSFLYQPDPFVSPVPVHYMLETAEDGGVEELRDSMGLNDGDDVEPPLLEAFTGPGGAPGLRALRLTRYDDDEPSTTLEYVWYVADAGVAVDLWCNPAGRDEAMRMRPDIEELIAGLTVVPDK